MGCHPASNSNPTDIVVPEGSLPPIDTITLYRLQSKRPEP